MAQLLYSFFVLFFVIEGSLVMGDLGNCELQRCESMAPKEELQKMDFIPSTEEELERLCPPTIEFMECVATELKKCTGRDIFELAASDNKTVAAIGNTILNVGNLIIDLCNKESDFHKNYMASASCFKELVVDPEPTLKCYQEGTTVYYSYKESLELLGEESNERSGTERWCMVTAYTLACFAAELQESCGAVARSVFVESLKRFQSMKWNQCSEVDVLALKTSFLDFLELEEEKKSIFDAVFSSKRRRK